MPHPVLEVQNLAKHFDIHHLDQRVTAFAGVSFSLYPGQLLLVRGSNGVGKSTLLRTLYRTYVPKAGQIWFGTASERIDLARASDLDIAELRARDIGFVTQFLIARPRVAAEEIVAEPLRLAGWTQRLALEEARRSLAEFGVKEELWRAFPTTFSGGEQQKVNLARALALPQKLLLLDEPTASLDHGAREALVRRLGALKGEGVAMIGVFHHPEDVAGLVDAEITLQLPLAAAQLGAA